MGNTEEEKKKKIEIDVDSDSDSYDGGDSSDDEKPTSDSNDPSPMSSTRSKKLDINMISFRLRKNVGTKLATSSLGKTAIRRILPDEPRQLLACIKALAATQYGKKKAAQLEHYFIKIIIKSLFIFSFYGDDGESTTTTTTATEEGSPSNKTKGKPLQKNASFEQSCTTTTTSATTTTNASRSSISSQSSTGSNNSSSMLITDDQIDDLDKPLREAFKLLVRLFDYYGNKMAKPDELNEQFAKVERSFTEAHMRLHEMLKPHLKQRSLDRLALVVDSLCKAEFLKKVWQDESIEKELTEVIEAMSTYISFEW